MSDETPKKRHLSEIGHLFLSSVRERHMGGSIPPHRLPPGRGSVMATGSSSHVDMTPADLEAEFAANELIQPGPAGAELPRRPVTALIAGHLAAGQLDRARQYARHLAAECGGRVGLIQVDSCEFRLMCFDPDLSGGEAVVDPIVSTESLDARTVAEAIEEMHWDVARWLILVPNPRCPEARELLRGVGHWTLLTTCDHDGVVSAYRMLKSLAGPEAAERAGAEAAGRADGTRPALSIAVLDSQDDEEAERMSDKLSGVCRQFLAWSATGEPAVEEADVEEHLVMFCRPARDQATISAGPQWFVVSDFLQRAAGAVHIPGTESALEPPVSRLGQSMDKESAGRIDAPLQPEPRAERDPGWGNLPEDAIKGLEQLTGATIAEGASAGRFGTALPTPSVIGPAFQSAPSHARQEDRIGREEPVPHQAVPASGGAPSTALSFEAEVIDLPSSDAASEAILSAVLHRAESGLAACPLRPPMCPDARLAVSRDRSLDLLADSGRGLGELRAIV